MGEVFSQVSLWLNANEGVLEGIAVILAVLAIAMPRFGMRIFRQNNQQPDLSKIDPRNMPVHPAYLAAYTGAIDKPEGDSVFAPKFGRGKQIGKRGKKQAAEDLEVKGRPVIAVFPPECPASVEGRADFQGLAAILAEELATGLDSIESYDVIAGRVTRGFNGHVSDLGARYLIEGSLREGVLEGEKSIRIILRLVDVGTGRHLWSERFNIAADKFYEQEDDLVARITASVFERLQEAEAERASRADPDRLDAWSLSVLAFSSVAGTDRTGQLNAEALARKAVEQEPESGYAHSVLAATLVQKLGFDRAKFDQKEVEDIRQAVSASRVFAPNDSLVLSIIGFVLTSLGDFIEAEDILERAIEINPSNARAWAGLGRALRNQGRIEEAITKLERALRLAPRDSLTFLWWSWIGSCYLSLGDFKGAIEAYRHAIAVHRPMFWAWLGLAASLAHLDRELEAKDALAEGQTLNPEVSADTIDLWILDSMGPGIDSSNLKEGLLKAGL